MGVRSDPLRSALVAAAVLAGLFAMHGLARHGEHLPATEGHVMAQVAGPAAVVLDEPGADAGDVLALCLAVLAGATLPWLLGHRFRTARVTLLPRTAAGGVPALPPIRAPDPPDRWTLAVCRC